jgi:hypothetical protein
LTEWQKGVIIYTCSNLEGVDVEGASLVLCCELATVDNSVDNLWIIPVATGVAFEQQNFSMNYPQVIHNLLGVIHSLLTGLCTGLPAEFVRIMPHDPRLVIHMLYTDLYTR